MRLVVVIDSGSADAYRTGSLELPGSTIAFEPFAGGWRGEVTIDDDADSCEREVSRHLSALAELSRARPTWRLRIEVEPDGGVLELSAGSFGTEDDDVAQLRRWATAATPVLDGAHHRLYVSVRLPGDAHAHFLDLVARELPTGWAAPVTEASPDAIAIGFDLTDDALRTAQLIGAIRYAWIAEGSLARALVELEGDHPIVRQIDGIAGWRALERDLRAVEVDDHIEAALHAMPPTAEPIALDALGPPVASVNARATPLPALGDRTLSWIDDHGQMFGVRADGVIRELEQRREGTDLVHRRDGSARAVFGSVRMELPPEAGVERTSCGACAHGLVLTERRGDATRIIVVDARGGRSGPVFRNVRAVALVERLRAALVVAEIAGHPALITLDLATSGWDHVAPWPADAQITDLAAASDGAAGLVATANVGDAGALYVIDAATGALARTIYVPGRDARVVGREGSNVWLTAASPSGARCDLVHVELAAGEVATSVLTAGISSAGWGPLRAARVRDRWLLAYAARGVFVTGREHDPIVALAADEVITSLMTDPVVAVFTTGPRGAHLTIGAGPTITIALPSPGYQPSW